MRGPYDSSQMDIHTLELLQFDKVADAVAAQAGSALGKERARALTPLHDMERITEALERVREMGDAIDSGLVPPLGGLRDVRKSIKKAILGVLLDVSEIRDLREVLDLTGRVADYWLRLGNDFPALSRLLSDVVDHRHLVRAIDAAIDATGLVLAEPGSDLARVRQEIAGFEEKIQTEIKRLLRSSEIRNALRYPQATMSGDHHVLPVAVNHRHKVVGVVHRTSPTGETVFIEPARVAQLSAEVSVLKSAELREIRKVLRRLTTLIGQAGERLSPTIDVLAELDLIVAKTRYGRQFRMTTPRLNDEGRITLLDARHPLLEALFKSPASPAREAAAAPSEAAPDAEPAELREIVPVSVRLGHEYDLLIITGPNTGGKTVALKTVGLLCAMALSGLPIPARDGAQVPLLRDILADIGDEQSIEQSLSTFSAHIARITAILEKSGPDTLVLLDELGAGTEPTEGAALGRAILDELVSHRCRAMVTTHLGDLKTYALSVDRAENAAMEFDAVSLRPTYRLMVGQTGQSCALKIARRLKLPSPILKRANKYLRRRRGRRPAGIAQVEQLRQEAEQARDRALLAEQEAAKAADEFRRRSDLLKQEASVSAELEKARASLRAGDSVRVARFDKMGTIVRVDQKRKLATVAVGVMQWEIPLGEIVPIPRSK